MMSVLAPQRYVNLLKRQILQRPDVDFWLTRLNPLWTFKRPTCKIVEKQHHGNFVSLTLQCNHLVQLGKAGQHHPVIVEINGRRYQRQYSLSHVDAHHVRLTAKKLPQGLVSGWLYETAQIGDYIELGTPYGEMHIDPTIRNIVFLVAGSGITPIYSLVQDLIQKNQIQQHQIQLLYWQKYRTDTVFFDELAQWQQRYPQLSVQCFFTQENQRRPLDTRLNTAHLADLDLTQTQVFVCGSAGFVHDAEQLCQNALKIQSEAFSLPVFEPDATQSEVHVTLLKSGKTLLLPSNQPLLDALEQANVKPKFGCRMGICNHCSCHKISGSTRNVLDQTENHEINQELRICVNRATSDLVLDL